MASQLLRIQVQNPSVNLNYLTSSALGDVLTIAFRQAELLDVNNNPLDSGLLQVNVATLSQFDLAILTRLLQPFQGLYTLTVLGSSSPAGASTNYIVVTADSVLSSDLQPDSAGKTRFTSEGRERKLPEAAQMQEYQIAVENPSIYQVAYQPNQTTRPGYDLIFAFANAQLTLISPPQTYLGEGLLYAYAKPAAFTEIHLAILARIMQAYSGSYSLQLGSYKPATQAGNFFEVFVDTIILSILEAYNPSRSRERARNRLPTNWAPRPESGEIRT